MISKEEVLKIAKLAHLSVSEEEIPELQQKLGAILEHVKQLQSVDTGGITPMSHVHGSTNVFRTDEAKESIDIEALKQNAPDMNGRFIRVPIIVD